MYTAAQLGMLQLDIDDTKKHISWEDEQGGTLAHIMSEKIESIVEIGDADERQQAEVEEPKEVGQPTQSPQWGWYVAITPPKEQYSAHPTPTPPKAEYHSHDPYATKEFHKPRKDSPHTEHFHAVTSWVSQKVEAMGLTKSTSDLKRSSDSVNNLCASPENHKMVKMSSFQSFSRLDIF